MMASTIEFDYTELSALQDRIEAASDTVLRISLNEGLRKIGRLIVPAGGTGPLASETPKRTGKLRRSTVFQIMGAPQNQWLEVRQAARTPQGIFYGQFVREGTRPHEIRPVSAKALRWWDEAGNPVFAMKVQHPGNAPNPYHKRVMARLKGDIQRIVNQMGEKVTAYIAGH